MDPKWHHDSIVPNGTLPHERDTLWLKCDYYPNYRGNKTYQNPDDSQTQ